MDDSRGFRRASWQVVCGYRKVGAGGRTSMKEQKRRICAVDVFCGAGGLTRGLLDAGIDVRAGYDIDSACRFPYTYNNGVPFRRRDVARLRPNELLTKIPEHPNLIAGCAPCQPHSILTNKSQIEDDRAHLLGEFSRLVASVQPTYVTMENVPGLRKTDVFDRFVDTLRENAYHVAFDVLDCRRYGVPQTRHRLVLVASRTSPIQLPKPIQDEPLTVRDVLSDLPTIGPGEVCIEDSLHRSANLSETNRLRIRASVPGGTWEDWPDELVLKCHQRRSGSSYKHAYGRMTWDDPAPTVTTKFFNLGSGRFGHPQQERALTPREAAILQTFPDDYKFVPEGQECSLKKMGELIGNAVPVRLGEAVGRVLVSHALAASSGTE